MKKMKLIIIGAILSAIAGIGLVSVDAATIDRGRDCDKYAIVYCGTMSVGEAREKYNQKDHAKVFQSFGISKADISGDIRTGVVYQDGRVVVDGKTVATGAVMAARHLGGSSISGSTTAKRVSVSKMGSAQEALVKFNKNGEFEWAIMKPCGNPVTAKKVPKPSAKCSTLSIARVNRTTHKLTGKASVSNGAKVKSYTFTVKNAAGKSVFTKNVSTAKLAAAAQFTTNTPGRYTASVTVNTTLGKKSGSDCVKAFTVEKPPVTTPPVKKTPGVTIDKTVDGVEHKKVNVNQEFTYQLVVKNTGQTDLMNVKVSDPAPSGVKFISADKGTITNNAWSYTIPSLKVGASATYAIKATVTKEIAGVIKNTACVDAPSVPGNPDDCDDATVEVPPKDVVRVCDLATKATITINEKDFDESKHSRDQADCEEAPEVPQELPETGPLETASSILGIGALIASSGYYIASRRSL